MAQCSRPFPDSDPGLNWLTADSRKRITWDEMKHDPDAAFCQLSPLDGLQLVQSLWDNDGFRAWYRKARM
jgi:hypothetical protein